MTTRPDPTTTPGSAKPSASTRPSPAPDPAADRRPAAVAETGSLNPAQRDQVLRLVAEAAEADGVAPLSEQAMLHVRFGGRAAPDDDRGQLTGHGDGQAEGDGGEPGRPGSTCWPARTV